MSKADKIMDMDTRHTFKLADMYDLAKDLESEIKSAVLAERESCAKVCDDLPSVYDAVMCADAIRERGVTK